MGSESETERKPEVPASTRDEALFGGSTVVLILEPGKAQIPEQYLAATAAGEEIAVRQGQTVGRAV